MPQDEGAADQSPNSTLTSRSWFSKLWPFVAPLLGLPLLYLLGFVSWAIHEANSNLGYLNLDAGQYLATGVALAVPIALGVVVLWACLFIENTVIIEFQETIFNDFLRAVAESLMVGVAFLVTVGFLIVADLFLPLLDQRIGGFTFGLALLVAIMVALTSIGIHGLQMFLEGLAGILKQISNRGKEKPHLKPRLKRRSIGYGSVLAASVAIAFVVMFGVIYLPSMNPAFGGGHVRHAFLAVDPSDLDNATALHLLPAAVWNTTGIVRTNQVPILFVDKDMLVIGLKTGTLELPRSVIRAIEWIDEADLFKSKT